MRRKFARRYVESYYKICRGIDPDTGFRKYEQMELPNGWLYTDEWTTGAHHRTKLTPDDLPEWYLPVWQSPYCGTGYISTQGVSDLAWWHPNMDHDNHSFRDFRLLIAYDGNVLNKHKDRYGFLNWDEDESLWGWAAVEFVLWCDEYSPLTVDTSAVKEAMIAKYNAYIDVITKEKEEFGWTHKITETKVKDWEDLTKNLSKPGSKG